MNDNVKIINHPVLNHKLGLLRDKNTKAYAVRSLVADISSLLAYEATKDLQTVKVDAETELAKTQVDQIKDAPVIVSIMRAGNGMLDAVMQTLSFSPAGHVGIYRDKFIKNTVEYYFKIPEDSKGKTILLLDPLLATGDTAVATIDRLKQYHVGQIRMLCILVSKTGVEKVLNFHPDVQIYTLSIENEVNDKGYLVPGMGDAGDRLFQTK